MRRTATVVAVSAVLLLGAAAPVFASSGELFITSSTTLTSDHDGNVVIGASGVTLDCAGHSIIGTGAPALVGIRADNVTDVTIKNCIVTGFNPHGIYAAGSAGLRLKGNTVLSIAGHAVYLAGSPAAVIVGNTIRESGFGDPYGGYGVVLQRSSGAVITGNTATDNKWAGFALVDESSQATVTSNTSAKNGDGFHVEPAEDLSFTRNIARDNYNFGFVVNGVAGGRFVANTANRNGLEGFNIQVSSNLTVERNVIRSNGLNQVWVGWTTASRFTGNAVKGNGEVGNGLVFIGSSDLRIDENVSEGSVGQCFGLYEGTHGVTLTGNTASGCPSAGFDLGDATGNTLTGNKASGNIGGPGFSLGPNATSNVLSGNISLGNTLGFQLWSSDEGAPSHNALARNVANANAAYGFVVGTAASDNSFVRNAAHANGDLDALQADDAGPGNVWFGNNFGTHAGF